MSVLHLRSNRFIKACVYLLHELNVTKIEAAIEQGSVTLIGYGIDDFDPWKIKEFLPTKFKSHIENQQTTAFGIVDIFNAGFVTSISSGNRTILAYCSNRQVQSTIALEGHESLSGEIKIATLGVESNHAKYLLKQVCLKLKIPTYLNGQKIELFNATN